MNEYHIGINIDMPINFLSGYILDKRSGRKRNHTLFSTRRSFKFHTPINDFMIAQEIRFFHNNLYEKVL
jgi:hypothetical protein